MVPHITTSTEGKPLAPSPPVGEGWGGGYLPAPSDPHPNPPPSQGEGTNCPIVLSFDVEEHDRIEAAAALPFSPDMRRAYADRMERTTRELLDVLAAEGVPATFYVVGEIAKSHPALVRDIAAAGHEVGSHGWDHKRVHRFSPQTFAEDLRTSVDALEQATGSAVVGYRAPTFSVMRQTAWAADVLADSGLRYDSSVFPVRHDRYGVPDAPRTPFLLEGSSGSILELPPATWRVLGQNLPVAGGGYFRLFPLAAMKAGIRQLGANPAVLYFHPWEFDPGQPKLPLKRLAKWRTYVGIGRTMGRLRSLIAGHRGRFCRAVDVVTALESRRESLPRYRLVGDASSVREQNHDFGIGTTTASDSVTPRVR